jgi:glycosyltransferase involved in cell wall biosynthesis
MRIAFVIPYFYPAMGYGGTPRVAYDMARALAKRGHELTILTTDSEGERRIPAETVSKIHRDGLDGVHVHFYRNLSNRLAYRHRLFLPTRFFAEVRTELAKCDVIHIHDLRSFLSVAAHKASKSLCIPYVLSPHGGLPRLGKESAKLVFDALWGKAILRDCAALCAISPLEERDAKALGVESLRIHPFPPAIDAQQFRNIPPAGTFARRWGLQSRKIILFLGRLHWIKGVDVLIEAMARLSDLSDLHLVVAGPDDGAEAQVRSLVKSRGLEKNVTFTGFLDVPDKLSALVDSQLLVIPSRREGFPLAVLEALAAGTPVILTSACELGDWIQQQPGLVSFRSEDPDDLAGKIKAALRHPPEREAMTAGRDAVMKNFSLDTLADRAELLYRSLV